MADTILFGCPNSVICNWKHLDRSMVYECVSFVSSEQEYMCQQAISSNDKTACSRILSSDDPTEAKMYNHKKVNIDEAEWENYKRGVIKHILTSTFRDEMLERELSDTGTKHRHEAGRETCWATGVSLCNRRTMI